MLIWAGPAPFARTVISSKGTPHNFPMPHEDMLEQAIPYPVVPLHRYAELAAFDGSITCRRTQGILSARCDNMAMNFLALNLAHDIIKGRTTIRMARESYTKIATAYKEGKRDALYTKGLVFKPKPGADPDISTVKE